MNNKFSGPVTIFHGLKLPEQAQPVGYAALIDRYDLAAPLPYKLCFIGSHHKRIDLDKLSYFTPRHMPESTLAGHLKFALRYEGLDLGVLKSLFQRINPHEIKKIVEATPTGSYARRLWFLYEWLMAENLDLPDLNTGNFVPVLDPDIQITIPGTYVSRQRVVNNLPGTREFCPLVFKTPDINEFMQKDLKNRASELIKRIPSDVMSRTASFLLLKDSKASYAIENETPPHRRIERWGQIIGQAGIHPLDQKELIRLQKIVIGDMRFVKPGLRTEGGFVGEHDRDTGTPIPEHISAKPDDLPALLNGLIEYMKINEETVDPVIASAVLAFGFVNIHPFVDGNGRLHRYLIHHVLAENGFNPPGLVFPVSAVMLDRIEEYRQVLQGYSKRILPLIQWQPTEDNNVEVSNETADYYRFFDATPHAEFLYSCVQRTIDVDLQEEARYLQCYDQFKSSLVEIVDMPLKTIDLLIRFLSQNQGKLSQRARDKEFKSLSDKEVRTMEDNFQKIMGHSSPGAV